VRTEGAGIAPRLRVALPQIDKGMRMSWIKRKWSWAKQKPLFWSNLLFLAAVVAVIWVWPAPNASDLRVRLLGMVLQLVGIATVWLDLTDAARHFGKGGAISFLVSTGKWLKAGIFGSNVTLDVHSGRMIVRGGRPRLKVRRTISPESPLPERIAALEALATQIDADLDNAFKEIEERASELKTKISTEAAAREHSINDVKRSLESTTTGNYAPLAFGAFWLAVGVVLATLAPEIALAAAGRGSEVFARMLGRERRPIFA